jgi:hypothetical protein
MTAPIAGSARALTLDFPTPMNYVLLQRMLWVEGRSGRVEGDIGIDRQESRWLFTPRAPWRPGPYRLMVEAGLEDLAGNHIGQAFDVDVFERVTDRISATKIALPFVVR